MAKKDKAHWMCLVKEAKDLGYKGATAAKQRTILKDASDNCLSAGKVQKGGLGAAKIAAEYDSLNIKKLRKELDI